MHFNLVLSSLIFSLYLINVVVCIEPITMGAIAAVMGTEMTSLRNLCDNFFFFFLTNLCIFRSWLLDVQQQR